MDLRIFHLQILVVQMLFNKNKRKNNSILKDLNEQISKDDTANLM